MKIAEHPENAEYSTNAAGCEVKYMFGHVTTIQQFNRGGMYSIPA